MQTVNDYFGHIGIFGMPLLGFLVQRAMIVAVVPDSKRKKTFFFFLIFTSV